MWMPRVMPCLLLDGSGLVKTVQFKSPNYVGDPINTIRILNEKEVDELILLDITATSKKNPPAFEMVEQVVSECFMPLTYGGGIRTLDHAKKLFGLGVEKVAINTAIFENTFLLPEIARQFGSQSVVVSVDVKKNFLKKYRVCSHAGSKKQAMDPVLHVRYLQEQGAGEILLTAIHQEGTFSGFDLELISQITAAVNIPVIANGGAATVEDIVKAISAGASAVALGSMVVYQGKNKAVLTNFPEKTQLEKINVRDEKGERDVVFS